MPSRTFTLHPQLAADCFVVGELALSRLLLMNDARFPWCILVPRRSGLRELHDLDEAEGQALWQELRALSPLLLAMDGINKLNVGALGNRVPQLHLHVVGRGPGDAAWPGPVWGAGQPQPYADGEAEARCLALRAGLSLS